VAVPATAINLLISVPIAMRVRLMRRQRLLTTILVLPITLGTVLVAEGLLNYLGPQGWLNRTLLAAGLVDAPIRLVHNYWGVLLGLFISGFPFTFLLTLSYVSGIDPSLERAAATLGARPAARFRHIVLPLVLSGLAIAFCLTFVQMFSVFPTAVLLGEPAGATRVISIAAYVAAYEEYNDSFAAAIAMIMGLRAAWPSWRWCSRCAAWPIAARPAAERVEVKHPRSASALPLKGAPPSGPAEPDPPRPLDVRGSCRWGAAWRRGQPRCSDIATMRSRGCGSPPCGASWSSSC
jgi:ABC-type spermidine/putrescine transport system permease subunit I